MIFIFVLFKICLSIWHTLINDSEHNFWNLSWIFDFQKSMWMRFILFTIFTIIEVFANTTLVSWTNNRSNSTAITLNIRMSNCRINLLGLLILVRDIIQLLLLHIFFLFFNNTLDQLFWLLIHWIFYHFFNSFFLFFPNFFLNIFWGFSLFFTFFAFFCIFNRFRISIDLKLFNFIFNIWITWSLILFFNRVFTFRFILILQRFGLSFNWNLFLLFLNKIFKGRFLIYTGIFLYKLIYQVTFFSNLFIWQDFEF